MVYFSFEDYVGKNSQFGTLPSKEYIERFRTSKQFDSAKKVFVNRRPEILKEMRKRAMSIPTFIEFFRPRKDRFPTKPLPEVKPDLNKFIEPSDTIKVIWFGHSTFLLNIDGKTILVDPVFSKSASPVRFLMKRFQASVLSLSELPPIDLILLSHDHYDHLDMETIKFFAKTNVPFLCPLGVSSHLIGWGINQDRITELDWWQEKNYFNIQFISTPAQHFSGRDGLHDNATLWCSWVIKSAKHSIYFSGDSGYDVHFKDIGEKYGPFDIAFMETGQYNELWREVHMLPEEAAEAFFDLKAKRYFPIHWGMFRLSIHTWYEPVEKIHQYSLEKNIPLVTPKLGQIVELNEQFQNQLWWKELI